MKKAAFFLVITTVLFACKPNVKLNVPANRGKAIFTTYLAVGNSLTAGYADGSLYREGQQNSYPQRLSEQFALVGGNNKFTQPLLPGQYGYPTAKLMLGYDSLCNGQVSLAPVNYTGAPDTAGSIENMSRSGPFNNFGIPGIRVSDYTVPGYAVLAKLEGAPYAYRMFSNVNSSPLKELQFTVNRLNPTFFTLWMGSNDVLQYALQGGVGNGNGTAVSYDGVYLPTDITPDSPFYKNYDSLVLTLIENGAKGALLNIPDITQIPFFNTIPYNGLSVSSGMADTLNKLYHGSTMLFHAGAGNRFVVQDHNGFTRQIDPQELILLSVPEDSMVCGGWGSIKPIPNKYVLTKEELQLIEAATTTFNGYIAAEAARRGLALVDMNSYLKTLASGISYNGATYNSQFVTGGAFSLDGIHLTQRGYAIVANYIITNINGYYKSSIPTIDVNKYKGVEFP
jgi:lysophospholipase L1-like esterase